MQLAGRNQDIQVLRGVAIVLVLLQHFNNRLPVPDLYKSVFTHVTFWGGVDVFFAISGYLIFRTFSRDMAQAARPVAALGPFLKRRFLRLFPAVLFWVVMSVLLAAFAVAAPYSAIWPIIKSGLAGLTGWSNLYYVLCVPDYAACGNADFNGVTWSLSAEWQFYLSLSLAMLLLGRYWAVAMLVGIAVWMATYPAPSWSIPWAFRCLGFMLGAVIALLAERVSWRPVRWQAFLLLIAGLGLVLSGPVHFPQPWVVPAISVGGGLCLLSSLGGSNYTGLLAGLVAWIGERSYSLYLCHLPCILLTREILTQAGRMDVTPVNIGLAVVTALALSLMAADLSYRHIEQRFMGGHAIR